MKLNLTILFLIFTASLAKTQDYFQVMEEGLISQEIKQNRQITPQQYQLYQLDIKGIDEHLNELNAQKRNKQKPKKLTLVLPDPTGKLITFEIFQTKLMESELAARYPNIKTYRGYNQENKRERIALGWSEKGFYAGISTNSGSYSIDRYANNQKEFYISYFHRDYDKIEGLSNICGTKATDLVNKSSNYTARNDAASLPLREYRLAIGCTGEFGNRYGPTKEDVLAELVKSVNRINLILENDLAIRLILVNESDKVIFLDAETDPYTDGNTGGSLLGENTSVLNNAVGASNYDLGHVYTIGCDDVGGIAFIRSICGVSKGAGVTCHSNSDISVVAVRVAAHEIGHQLGSNHTFNNCSGNESSGTAYEPGSGSTIMSYGGLCGAENNVTSTSDDYFHISSIIEIIDFTRNEFGNSCAEKIETQNIIPTVSIPIESGFSIPISTPFELNGEASDENGDNLTYNWDQFDLGPSTTLGEPVANSPLFRSVYPSQSPIRIFPKIETILSNSNDKTEVLPTYGRDLNFQFITRDNNLEAGGVAWTQLQFESVESAGPFLIEYPNSYDTFTVGTEIELLWDVANTDLEPINCKSVDIYLSEDGGYTYNYLIAGATSNDGSEKIFLPNVITNKARFKVKAANNVFFDISNENFEIKEPSTPGFTIDYTPSFLSHCVPDDITINFNTYSFLEYDQLINFEFIDGLPEGMVIDFNASEISPGESTSAIISFTDESLSGIYELNFKAASESDTLYRSIVLDLSSVDFSDISPVHPAPGTSGNVVNTNVQWTKSNNAENYRLRLSDNPSFDLANSELIYDEIIQDTFFSFPDILNKSTIYYWSIEGLNSCSTEDLEPKIYTFATEAISCEIYDFTDLPLGLTASIARSVEMPIEVFSDGKVKDVNIRKIKGVHSFISELKGELVSPSGTSIVLFSNKCGNQTDFNCGFDDDAVTELTCPLSQGLFYLPQEKLDTFIGEDIKGIWKFIMSDTKAQNGGSIQEYKLELCSNATLASPILVNNNPMPLPSGVARRLSNEFLSVEDDNNSNSEIFYTIVTPTANGSLLRDGEILSIGSTFTQEEIDNKIISYQHAGVSDDDSFVFTVQDGEGGWVDLTIFDIVVDNDVVLDVTEIEPPEIKIYPNPTSGHFFLELDESALDINVQIFDITGKSIEFRQNLDSNILEVSITKAVPGLYFLNVSNNDISRIRKIVIN